MTDRAALKQPKGGPKGTSDLARFLQDWTSMWREEMRAQTSDPEAMAGAMEMWRAAMAVWGAVPPPLAMPEHDTARTPRAEAADVASLAVDDEVQQLARRVDELESRLKQLELPGRRLPAIPPGGRNARRD